MIKRRKEEKLLTNINVWWYDRKFKAIRKFTSKTIQASNSSIHRSFLLVASLSFSWGKEKSLFIAWYCFKKSEKLYGWKLNVRDFSVSSNTLVNPIRFERFGYLCYTMRDDIKIKDGHLGNVLKIISVLWRYLFLYYLVILLCSLCFLMTILFWWIVFIVIFIKEISKIKVKINNLNLIYAR